MARFGVGRTVGYRRLRALVDHGVLTRARLLNGQPALYVATREGLAWVGMPQLDPARVAVTRTRHWALCARLAVVLERTDGGVEVGASRGYAQPSSKAARAIASVQLGTPPDGRPPAAAPGTWLLVSPEAAPVAVGLAVRGARRLQAICRAWARCRIVSEVRYYAPPHVGRAVSRAVSCVHVDAIRVLSLNDASDVRLAA